MELELGIEEEKEGKNLKKNRRASRERKSGIENKTDDTYHSTPDTLHQYPHMLCSVTVKNRAHQLPIATGFSTMKSKTSNLLQCHSKNIYK